MNFSHIINRKGDDFMYQNQDEKENVLEKYGRDITQDAKMEKLIPLLAVTKKFVESRVFYPEKLKIIRF